VQQFTRAQEQIQTVEKSDERMDIKNSIESLRAIKAAKEAVKAEQLQKNSMKKKSKKRKREITLKGKSKPVKLKKYAAK